MKKNLEFLSKALSLLPEVKETLVPPKEGQFFSKPLGKGDSVTIDFGKHLVGHLQVKMGYVNSHPDAPVWIRFSFAENLKEFEEKKPCPKIDIDGVISKGKQFDLDITLPEDHRNVIYGVVRNCFKEPVCDAVVKLVEVVYDCGKEERRPVGHTFTDKEGEFVFGPLCPDKQYALQIWVNDTKKIKICTKCSS